VQVVKEFLRKATLHVMLLLRNELSLSPHAIIDNGEIPFAA